ncbi:MAG TPA: hypothetical protein VKD04_00655 [Burkholderiales bacterium]|nr:hypothetical protein [Burkholderiales bacterium]
MTTVTAATEGAESKWVSMAIATETRGKEMTITGNAVIGAKTIDRFGPRDR